ncbi:cyclic nucleotide-binding domain-containing protein [bacterium]|nr:cyclic nucleotide-binding domain-containing protein [bacterium]
MDRLLSNKLFEGLSDSHFERLESFIKIKKYPKDSALIEEGVHGETLYLLISGKVKVSKTSDNGKELVLAIRSGGDFFGEMSLLEDAPRSARIMAIEDCEAGLIAKKDFTKMMLEEPQVALNILKTVSARLRQTNDQIIESFLEREKAGQKQTERFQALFEFSKAITADCEERTLFKLAPVILKDQLSCDNVKLFLYDKTAEEVSSLDERGTLQQESAIGSVYTNLIQIKKTLQIHDFTSLEHYRNAEPVSFWKNTASVLVAPIIEDRLVKGCIIVKSNIARKWPEDDEAFVAMLSSYVAISLRNISLRKQMLVTEKLSAVGKVSSSILHDFKNLLSVIDNYAKFILKADHLNDVKAYVDKILTSSNLMISMSHEVLFYAQGEVKLNRREWPLLDIFNTVIQLIENRLKANHISLTVNVPPSMNCTFDSDKISRAFYNLLINACDAVPKSKGAVVIDAKAEGKTLTIIISDNGSGISQQVLPRIFDPFVTTKSHGTGLGLAIVKNIVDAHGGKIEAQSHQGGGTRFIMTFPLENKIA